MNAERMKFLEGRVQKLELAHDRLVQENKEREIEVADLKATVLDYEKDQVTVRLELESLRKLIAEVQRRL